ncbi:MAG: XdhC/CoxI family protein [Candidatus Marinimicrobia bacterium]|nr:XdhC/CoxI family protein [Candidatus Neomarinimicrobiota bacterium]MCF7829537.1 XdhC/CoxI family protein [Candidatus Neomarinimicrobiota bacterium]MCF7880065.1 XdhC/CoxI family protein [Candidatus Neomarinimicrobiota bacterium]
MENIYRKIAELIENGQAGVLVTVIDVSGSAPRHPGSKMLVLGGGTIVGTIGGGKLEVDAIAEASKVSAEQGMVKKSFVLNEENDMLCGGTAELLFEPVGSKEHLVIFGAGHIGYALAPLAKQAEFRVTIVDDRPEYANPERFPDADKIVAEEYPGIFDSVNLTKRSYVVIVTNKHIHDEEVLRFALEQPHKYIGMIGSRNKSRKVLEHLRKDGFGEELLSTVHTPVGLNIGAETPFEIAVSILSEMIAVKRGMDTDSLSMKLPKEVHAK